MPDVITEAQPLIQSSKLKQRSLAALCAVATFIAFLFLYTRYNTFPSRYHPDEEGKANQILSDYRNFRHPQLLLEASSLVIHAAKIEEQESAVVAGRWVSASFAAGAVVALALAAYLEAGLLAMIVAGLFIGLSPYLFIHAHYMKEDTALVLGLAVFVLAARMIWNPFKSRWPEYFSVILLGAGCALATSGKYVGAFTIPIAFLILFAGRRWRWSDLLVRPVLFIGALVALLWLINQRAIAEMPEFREVFEREAVHPLRGHYGVTMPVPHIYFVKIIAQATPIPVFVLCMLALVAMRFTWRQRSGWDYFLLALIAIQIVMLSWCRSFFPRYALPSIVLLHLLAALGIFWTWQWLKDRIAPLRLHRALTAVAVFSTVLLGLRIANVFHQMHNDSRDRVREYLIANTKEGDRIIADSYAGFFRPLMGSADGDLKDGVPIRGTFYVANYGDAASLKDRGFTHIVVSRLAFGRYFDPDITAEEGSEDQFDTIKHNYQDIFDHAELVWQSTPSPDLLSYVNPEIRVYRLK